MKIQNSCFLLFALFYISCSTRDIDTAATNPGGIYFPPKNSQIWESVSPESLNWNSTEELYSFLKNTGTKAFIILKNGKIAVEWYGNGATKASNLPWNSAGKTLSAFLMGIAQQEDYLSIEESSQKYLGMHWSSLTSEQEQKIKIRNHLTMTTGLDYTVENIFCYDAECLQYLNEPGEFWFYHNAPYTLTQDIIEAATTVNFQQYFNSRLRNKIGMQGAWVKIGYNNIYFSNARSMARFGLLNLNNAVWDVEQILNTDYFEKMVTTSQNLNESYGFLWWLNGKSSFRIPGSTSKFSGEIIPNAPSDLFSGLGANDQKLYISPSKKLVIVRMGGNGGEASLGVSSYDYQLWEKINEVIE